MRRGFQSFGFLLCVLVSLGGAYNVLSDNADVEHLAQETACSGGSLTMGAPLGAAPSSAPKPPGTARPPADAACHPQKTRMERTPLAQTFDFATAKRTVTVRCARAAILAGDYTCELR